MLVATRSSARSVASADGDAATLPRWKCTTIGPSSVAITLSRLSPPCETRRGTEQGDLAPHLSQELVRDVGPGLLDGGQDGALRHKKRVAGSDYAGNAYGRDAAPENAAPAR